MSTPPSTPSVSPSCSLSAIGAAHAGVLAALHAEAFASPWTAADFTDLLADPGVFGLILCRGDEPLGLVLMRVVLDEAEVLTIGVRPQARRGGVGRALLAAALDGARQRGAARVFLEVAAGNAPAQALYAAFGFAGVGQRRGYYRHADGSREDAVMMAL